MKATGIVRRIDDLGRVVIPKEIRRTMRIREGDPLEIFTERDGEVIFKKYSPIGELSSFATQYAETLSKTSGFPTVITDKDSVIAVSGVPKKELNDKRISIDIEKIMRDKTTFIDQTGDKKTPVVDGEDKHTACIIAPIVSEGDSIGTVVFLYSENVKQVGEVEEKLVQSAAVFLSKQIVE